MKKQNANESIRRAAKNLKIKSDSLKRQLRRGKVSGDKDKNGCWIMTDEDVDEYKNIKTKIRKPPKDCMTTNQVANCLGMQNYQVIELIQNGSLEAIKFANKWWIENGSYFDFLGEKINSYDLKPLIICRKKLKILNRYGACIIVSTKILKILREYSGLSVYIHKDDRKWTVENVLDIYKHQFQQHQYIDLEIEGTKAFIFMDNLYESSLKLFGLKK